MRRRDSAVRAAGARASRFDGEANMTDERAQRFWTGQFQSFDEPTLLADALVGARRGSAPSGRGEMRAVVDGAVQGRLARFAEDRRAKVAAIIEGAWALMLQRYCGQAAVTYGRLAPQAQGVESAGAILPRLLSPRPDVSVDVWLRSLDVDNWPPADAGLVSPAAIERWIGREGAPLFDTAVIFGGDFRGELNNAPRAVDLASLDAACALALLVRDATELEIVFSYRRESFDDKQIESIRNHFLHLIGEISANPSAKLGELALLASDERALICDAWSRAEDRPIDAACLHELFEAQAKEQADAVAAIHEGASLTYGALNARANQLARRLRRLGVGPEVLVGLAVERSLDMAVGLLAILKAGGAYVPLDPNYPKERLAYMIENAGVSLVLTQARLIEALPPTEARIWRIDGDWAEAEAESAANLDRLAAAENLAYCLYTSGSTGRPKGAALAHAALVNLLRWQASVLPGALRTLQFASLSFDVSFQEIFGCWIAGGALVIPSEEVKRDFRALLRLCQAQAIERLHLPTAVLQPLAAVRAASGAHLPDLRQIIVAGEQLRLTPDVSAWLRAEPQCALINQYGPTETHVVSNFTAADESDGALPPIGRPIWNAQLYILDADLNPAPAGIVGELYIGGIDSARGYVGRPELAAERFVPDPFARRPGRRLYRTGDLARWRSDGEIEYVGRADHQVKVRGFRIEIGEIEARLLAHEDVAEAAVVAQDGASGKQLVGYVVAAPGLPEPGRTADARVDDNAFLDRLKQCLRAVLPDYMVPARLVALDHMPMTPSGKIDRKALPALPVSDAQEIPRAQPATEPEATLAGIFARLLRLPYVDLDANFFDLGGSSLDVVALHEEIRARFQQDLPVTVLFDNATVRAIAARLKTRDSGKLSMEDFRNRKLRQNEALQRIWRSRTRSVQ